MTAAAQALYRFFSGFGMAAYGKNNVPDGAEMPYITYEVVQPVPLGRCLLRAWVWTRGDGMDALAAAVDQIAAAVAGGASIPAGNGSVVLFPDPGAPLVQEQPDPDQAVRVGLMTMIMHMNCD